MATFRVQRETALHPLMYESLKDGDDWSPAIAQMVTDHAALIAAGNGAVGMDFGAPGSVYEISDPFDISNIPIIGYPEFRPDFIAEPIVADGSIGTFEDLDANATRGENRIICAALASAVARGDVLKIASDAAFNSAEASVLQGEMVRVRNVVDDTIYFSDILNDTYTTANGARAAIVTEARVDVQGIIKVVHSPAATDTQTRGVRFNYARVRGRFDVYSARATTASFNNCYRPDVRVDAGDAVRTGSSITAYGISIQNATCYGRFRGVIAGARHGVACSGSPGDAGVPWENHVTATVLSGYPASMFDAHSNTGSVYWDRCVGISGSVYALDESLPNNAPGFGSGARYNYINDCLLIRPGTGAQPRNNGGDDVYEFIVNGLHIVDGTGAGVSKPASSAGVRKFVVHNLTGNVVDETVAALNFASGDIDEWDFSEIRLKGGRLFNAASSLTSIPTLLEIDGFAVQGPNAAESDSDVVGVSPGLSSPITRIRLLNGSIRDMYYAAELRSALDLFEMINVDCDRSFQHVLVDAVTVAHMKLIGGAFRRSRHGAAQGAVVGVNSAAVSLLEYDNIEVDTDPLLAGAGANVAAVLGGTIKTHSSMTGLIGAPAGTVIEYLAGGPHLKRIIRVTGSPEGVVTAGIGTLALRSDGGVNTAAYLKEAGTSASSVGWKQVGLKRLAAQAIGTTQTTIAHGLGYTPETVLITPLADARVWVSQAQNSTNLFLTASSAINCDIYVR